MHLLKLLFLIKGVTNVCDHSVAALYNVTIDTHWTQHNFPKQFPTWRPPAQWSSVFGFSHAAGHSLFNIGSVASDQVATFVETGDTTGLLSAVDMDTILDMVTAPAITTGEGSTHSTVFVDGQHSKVKLDFHHDWNRLFHGITFNYNPWGHKK